MKKLLVQLQTENSRFDQSLHFYGLESWIK